MDSRSESVVDVMMMIYYVDSTIDILRAALMIYSPALVHVCFERCKRQPRNPDGSQRARNAEPYHRQGADRSG